MRATLLLVFIGFLSSVSGQDHNHRTAKRFWNSYVKAIVKDDVDQLVSQTHFPLEVNRKQKELWGAEQLKQHYKELFTPEIVAKLKDLSIGQRDAWTLFDGTATVYTVSCHSNDAGPPLLVSFKQFDGKWVLYNVEDHR